MRQRGFTILEVLVALIIVSIGLVGLVGLVMTGEKNNLGAYERSHASWLAYDMLDRMRANRTLAKSGAYNINIGVSASGTGIANTDLTQWKQELATALPAGDGSVTVTNGVAVVAVNWNDSHGLGLLKTGGYVGYATQAITIQALL